MQSGASLSRPQPTNQPTSNIPRQIAGPKRTRCQIRSLAKLITPGERNGIRNRENQGNHCTPISLTISSPYPSNLREIQLTNKRQPKQRQLHKTNQLDNGHNPQEDPQCRLRIQRQPKESLIRRIDLARVGVRALENPFRVSGCGIDFVPPAEPDEAPPGDVLEVVEVDREEDYGDDEDQDAGGRRVSGNVRLF
jgi:hypothetical protein